MNATRTFKPAGASSAIFYRLFDLISIYVALQCAAYFYDVVIVGKYLTTLMIVLVSYLYCAEGLDIYRSWRAGKFRHMVSLSALALFIAFLGLFIIAFLFKFTESLSRVVLLSWFILSFVTLMIWRVVMWVYKKHRRRLGLSMRKVAIVGATQSGAYLHNQIMMHEELGYEFKGFFEDRKAERMFTELHHHVEGPIDSIIAKARRGEIDVLFIALPLKAEKRIADILLRLGDTTVDVHFIPDFLLSNLIHARIEHVGDVDTLSVFESPYLGIKEWIKRTEDIVIGSLILLLISPVLIAVAIGVKLTSKGPVLFKQDRYGLDGRKIKVWKFRSMKVMENSEVVKQATKNDSRITPFGGFLRRTSLDELPQFFNVITGDMSIVGPRPHAVAHNEEYRKKVAFYMLRHKAKPGITGWAQINGWRGETDTLEKMTKRVEYDLHYIKHWSLWFDVKIIFLTIFKGFVNKNAY